MVLTRSLLLAIVFVGPAAAVELPEARPGWVIERTAQEYTELAEQVDPAVAASPPQRGDACERHGRRKVARAGDPGQHGGRRVRAAVRDPATPDERRRRDRGAAPAVHHREPRRDRDAELQDRRARARTLYGGGWSRADGAGRRARPDPHQYRGAGDRRPTVKARVGSAGPPGEHCHVPPRDLAGDPIGCASGKMSRD